MALKPRMKSGLADSMESWASLWEDSGWVWYTLVFEHGGLRQPGGLAWISLLRCRALSAQRVEKAWWLLCPALPEVPRTCRSEARGSGLTEDCSLHPACCSPALPTPPAHIPPRQSFLLPLLFSSVPGGIEGNVQNKHQPLFPSRVSQPAHEKI